MEDIISELNESGKEVVFLGDGVPIFKQMIAEKMNVPYSFAPAHMNRQRASSVAVLGAELFARGITVSGEEHLPEYLRMSQAERERMEKLC